MGMSYSYGVHPNNYVTLSSPEHAVFFTNLQFLCYFEYFKLFLQMPKQFLDHSVFSLCNCSDISESSNNLHFRVYPFSLRKHD